MITFALDCAGKTAGVAILKDDTLLYESYLATGFTHSETLLVLINSTFTATNLTPADVTCYAVTSGPGSFTGLRIGLALIKGLAFAHNTPCVAVSTLEGLAMSCVIPQGTVLCALDARRNEVYYAAFEKNQESYSRLCKDSAGPALEVLSAFKNCKKPLMLIGDGAKICYNMLENKCDTLLYPADYRSGRAGSVARIGFAEFMAGRAICAAQLQPCYLRLSQAERERKEKLAASQAN
ncbi:MAG: tRNA (adenosine(37)-N6)-threonylcarbamoyltransferase complex dimerization subunit type 1 TsaB [Oscillospiraceae bacterium]|nr:tRNA (adenosine(37)-N6)-threonylcarbamoyltransferase complex dimerization subunit type 1 TsaB [Oscillospiraceae bacterium]